MSESEFVQLRPEMARLARNSRRRFHQHTKSMPCDWSPGVVENPETGMPFTDVSAWELICTLLEDESQIFRELTLRQPPGCKAFETTCRLGKNLPEIYIKVQLWQEQIICRSFHPSLR
jgi:hypothetical protein